MDQCNGSSHNTRSDRVLASVWRDAEGRWCAGTAAYCGQCGGWQTPTDVLVSPTHAPQAVALGGLGAMDTEVPQAVAAIVRMVDIGKSIQPRWNGDAPVAEEDE